MLRPGGLSVDPGKISRASMGTTLERSLLQADHQKHSQAMRELRQTYSTGPLELDAIS
jgi:hypothetical protein